MRFVFLVPGMPLGAQVLEQGSLGGSESTGLYLARELARRGHEVHVFGNLAQPERWAGVTLLPMGPMTPQTPLGAQFTAIADAMPHDATIVQRAPQPFSRVHAGRVQLWWLHDLARRRLAPALQPGRWMVDGVLTPTDWHGDQVGQVFKQAFKRVDIHTVRNGVDVALFARPPSYVRKRRAKRLLYTSRPERGLRYLVRPDGIMAKLAALDPMITLEVCTYDNPVPDPTYQRLYAELEAQARALPNVRLLPPQPKAALAELMTEAALLVYPVVPAAEHEETSCISVMEAQCGGTPVITCDNGAIRETLGDGCGTLIPYLPDGEVDEAGFVQAVMGRLAEAEAYDARGAAARERALATYTLEQPAAALEALVEGRTSPGHHRPAPPAVVPTFPRAELGAGLMAHLERARLRGQRVAVLVRPEEEHAPDHEAFTAGLRANLTVVDDLAQADLVLDLRLLAAPARTLGDLLALNQLAVPGTRLAVAAVMGAPRRHPWEAYALDPDMAEHELKALGLTVELVPANAHVDPEAGHAQWGWVCWTAAPVEDAKLLNTLGQSLSQPPRGEGLSVLMICREDAEVKATLASVLPIADEVIIGVDREPLGTFPDQYWGGIELRDIQVLPDKTLSQSRVTVFALEHRPLVAGFDAARNEVLARCREDWVLWIDSDETLTWPRRVSKYLRRNGLEAYAVPHRHLAADAGPNGNTLKLDLPSRLFRREAGLAFRGVVHEHPCHLPDEVPTPIHVVTDFEILHPGYYSEEVRRKRFERNLPLMLRDRQANPDRMLGKLLMIRDYAQGIRWERLAAGQGPGEPFSPAHQQAYDQALALWREVVASPPDRLPGNFMGEVIQFISELSLMRHGPAAVQFSYALRLAQQGLGDIAPGPQPPEVLGALPTAADVQRLVARLAADKFRIVCEEAYL